MTDRTKIIILSVLLIWALLWIYLNRPLLVKPEPESKMPPLDWSGRTAYDSNGPVEPSVDWYNSILVDENGPRLHVVDGRTYAENQFGELLEIKKTSEGHWEIVLAPDGNAWTPARRAFGLVDWNNHTVKDFTGGIWRIFPETNQ